MAKSKQYSLPALIGAVCTAAGACSYLRLSPAMGWPVAIMLSLAAMILPYFVLTRHGADRAYWVGFAAAVYLWSLVDYVVRIHVFDGSSRHWNEPVAAAWYLSGVALQLIVAVLVGAWTRHRYGRRHRNSEFPSSSN